MVPKGKSIDYYYKTKRGLKYVTPVPSESEPEYVESFKKDHSSDMSSWTPTLSVGALFNGLSVKMVSAS